MMWRHLGSNSWREWSDVVRHPRWLISLSLFCFATFFFCMCSRTVAEDTSLKIRHVFVPTDKANDWPKGEFEGYYEPVPFAEYEELRSVFQGKRHERNWAHIPWQSLSATFDPGRGVLTDGRWTAEVRSDNPKPQLMSLEPLDLPLSELRWTDGDAVWGTSPSGEALLRVEKRERRLEGTFSRQGRHLQRTWQFPLRLASATVSELKLRVPSRFSVKCSAGTLRGPLSTGEEGWRTWLLNLGSQSRCDLLVSESPMTVTTEPVVVYDQVSSYSLREAEVEVQFEINAEIFHTPKATLSFAVPDDLSVYTVGFSGDSRLKWRELPRTPGQPRHVEVILPQPQIGKVRALQILAGSAAKWAPTWTLPRIMLAGGWFNGGRWNVSVDAPLVWNALQTNGLRLTEVDVNTPDVRRLSFSQYLADAALALDVSYPVTRLSAQTLQRLTSDESGWRLTLEWLTQSTSGVSYSTRCRVPAGWEILDVLSISDASSSEVLHWNLITEASGERILVCDFASPLEERSPQRIRVEAQRSRSVKEAHEVFELPTPLECLHSDQLLVVTVPSGWKWDTADDAVPAPVAMKRFADPWSTFELWKDGASKWRENTLLSRSVQNNTPLKPIAAFVLESTDQNERSAPVGVQASQKSKSAAGDLSEGENPIPSTLNPAVSDTGLTSPALVWTSAELRSLIFPGGDGDDMHWLSLRAAEITRVGRLEFGLPTPADLVSVRMNGVRTETQQNGRTFQLPSIPQGGLQTLEIQYRVPSDRDFLRNRETIPIPSLEAPVLGFYWLFALPPEARIAEEPAGLRLLQPLDPTPWIRRLFGPLGRDEMSNWFNPISRRSWNDLWVPTQWKDPQSDTPAAWFAPRGWRVREASAPSLPTAITWVSWNAGQVRILAWIGMLFSATIGCIMRCRQTAPRVHIAAAWLGACVVGVVLSSPVYAEGLGGCLIGTVIAVLIPRRLLMSYATRREASARGAFEVTVAVQRVVGVMLVSLTLALAAFAADEPVSQATPRTIDNREAINQRFDVLIPVDDPRDALAEFVRPSEKLPMAWVPTPLLARWRDHRVRLTSPGTLLSSAQYNVEVKDQFVSVKAEYLIHRLIPEQAATLLFPFANIPLSGANACLLDGQPYSQFALTNNGTLQLDLPPLEPAQSDEGIGKVVTQRVAFTLLPPLTAEESVSRLKLSLPPLLNSSMTVKLGTKSDLSFDGRKGEALIDTSGDASSARLGKITELWLDIHKPGVTQNRRMAEVKVDVTCFAELAPTALRQRYRARYSVASGEVNDVTWNLPRGVLLRDGDVQADDLLQWSVEPLGDNRQKLVIEFSKPQTNEFTVDVFGLQPPLGTPEQPRWEPWSVESPPDEPSKSGSGAKLKLGVTSLPGFKVTMQSLNADQTVPMTEAAFAKSWVNAVVPKQPQVLLQLSKPVELLFQVAPIVSQRKVRQELLLRLGRKSFEWELYAEVTTTGAAAFQHELVLSPQFRVDAVKVTEDEAERLLSWAMNDQRLTLFLRSETTGIQNIFLQGKDATPADGRLTIPTRWLADAELSEFSVRVTHDPEWQAQVFGDRDEPLAPVEVGSPIPDRPELFLGKFRAKPGGEALALQLTPHQAAGSAEAWTVIAPTTSESWMGRHIERLIDRGQITARIFWPTAWQATGTLRLSSSLKELARRSLPDGFELTVQSIEGSDAPRELYFESAIPLKNAAAIRLSPPSALDMGERSHQWLFANELSSWLAVPNDGQPVRDLTVLPETVSKLLSITTKSWLLLSATASTIDLRQPDPTKAAPTPKLAWTDTAVWVADGAITQGRTWFLLQPSGMREFAIHRPDGIHWTAAFINDRLQVLPQEPNLDLKIAEIPSEPLVWISIFWQVDPTSSDRIVARRDVQLPMPIDAKLVSPIHDMSLISVGNSEVSSTRGARRVQDWDGRLSRASHILRSLQLDPKATRGPMRRLWNLVQTDLNESRRVIDQLPPDVGFGNSAREQLQSTTADYESLKARNQQLGLENATNNGVKGNSTGAGSGNDAVTWASDAWLQVPSSWIAVADADQSAKLSVIVVDRRWLTWTLAVLAIIGVIPLLRTWLRWQTGEWLARHPNLAWSLLAIIWWTCLAPSIVGFGLLVLAALTALRQRQYGGVVSQID